VDGSLHKAMYTANEFILFQWNCEVEISTLTMCPLICINSPQWMHLF